MTTSKEPWTVEHTVAGDAKILAADGRHIGTFFDGRDAERAVSFHDEIERLEDRIATLNSEIEGLEDDCSRAKEELAQAQ